MDKKECETALILKNVHCRDCGWPIIFICCNGDFLEFQEIYEIWDWWQYCSNKNCKNHEGEGVSQQDLDWVKSN